jgi:hypothetical protein
MYHLQKGLFFRRDAEFIDPSIEIIIAPPCRKEMVEDFKVENKIYNEVIFKTRFPVSSFASAIASCSARGETWETYSEASELLEKRETGLSNRERNLFDHIDAMIDSPDTPSNKKLECIQYMIDDYRKSKEEDSSHIRYSGHTI